MTRETADSWFSFLGVVATTTLTIAFVSAVSAGLIVGALHLGQRMRDR
ncbi:MULTISPECIES: hypothetical protein [Rhodococcus]|nr:MULTISPECIES: hypothetical protein [Rhodococcus]